MNANAKIINGITRKRLEILSGIFNLRGSETLRLSYQEAAHYFQIRNDHFKSFLDTCQKAGIITWSTHRKSFYIQLNNLNMESNQYSFRTLLALFLPLFLYRKEQAGENIEISEEYLNDMTDSLNYCFTHLNLKATHFNPNATDVNNNDEQSENYETDFNPNATLFYSKEDELMEYWLCVFCNYHMSTQIMGNNRYSALNSLVEAGIKLLQSEEWREDILDILEDSTDDISSGYYTDHVFRFIAQKAGMSEEYIKTWSDMINYYIKGNNRTSPLWTYVEYLQVSIQEIMAEEKKEINKERKRKESNKEKIKKENKQRKKAPKNIQEYLNLFNNFINLFILLGKDIKEYKPFRIGLNKDIIKIKEIIRRWQPSAAIHIGGKQELYRACEINSCLPLKEKNKKEKGLGLAETESSSLPSNNSASGSQVAPEKKNSKSQKHRKNLVTFNDDEYKALKQKSALPYFSDLEIKRIISDLPYCLDRADKIFINQSWEIMSELLSYEIEDENGNLSEVEGNPEGALLDLCTFQKDVAVPAFESVCEILEKGYVEHNGEELPVVCKPLSPEDVDMIFDFEIITGEAKQYKVSSSRFKDIFGEPVKKKTRNEERESKEEDMAYMKKIIEYGDDDDKIHQLSPIEYMIYCFLVEFYDINKQGEIEAPRTSWVNKQALMSFYCDFIKENVTERDFLSVLYNNKLDSDGALQLKIRMFSKEKIAEWNRIKGYDGI